jgi:NO-binding membrane sensor protein with MHYT domain
MQTEENMIVNHTILAEYAICMMHYTKLLLDDVFDLDHQMVQHNTYTIIVTLMVLLVKQMINGQPNATYVALVEASS